MLKTNKIVLSLTAVVLGACSSAPTAFIPAISGSSQKTAAGYSITQNGTTTAFTTEGSLAHGNLLYWTSGSSTGFGYSTADVTAAVDISNTAPYGTSAGIIGNLSTTVPTTGSGSYLGDFGVVYYRGGTINAAYWSIGAFTTNVDFNAGTLAGSGTESAGGTLTVSGALQGAQFNGTADFTALDFAGATNVPMTGGFYGANTVEGILQNGAIAGLFTGQ